MIMFGEDAIKVIIPLVSAAMDNGMSRRLRFSPVLLAIVRTTGMNIATIAEELINAPIPPASNMMRTINRVSLRPPAFNTISPRRCAIPVFTSAWPTMKMAAMRITTGSPKPANDSCGVSTRVSISANTTRIATISARGRPKANSPTAPASTPKTISIWPVMIPGRFRKQQESYGEDACVYALYDAVYGLQDLHPRADASVPRQSELQSASQAFTRTNWSKRLQLRLACREFPNVSPSLSWPPVRPPKQRSPHGCMVDDLGYRTEVQSVETLRVSSAGEGLCEGLTAIARRPDVSGVCTSMTARLRRYDKLIRWYMKEMAHDEERGTF